MLNASNLRDEVIEFFYDFSRFEFALKECGFLKNKTNAEPDWDLFVKKYKHVYKIPNEHIDTINYLLSDPPKKQKTNEDESGSRSVYWSEFNIDTSAPPLKTLTDIVKTVRNNLFHGGKYGEKSWDDRERVIKLLKSSQVAIHSFLPLHNEIEVFHKDFA